MESVEDLLALHGITRHELEKELPGLAKRLATRRAAATLTAADKFVRDWCITHDQLDATLESRADELNNHGRLCAELVVMARAADLQPGELLSRMRRLSIHELFRVYRELPDIRTRTGPPCNPYYRKIYNTKLLLSGDVLCLTCNRREPQRGNDGKKVNPHACSLRHSPNPLAHVYEKSKARKKDAAAFEALKADFQRVRERAAERVTLPHAA